MRKVLSYIMFSLLVGVCTTSCDSMLETKSKDSLPQSSLNNLAGAESMVLGVYDMMQSSSYYGRNLIATPEILADNCRLSQGGYIFRGQYNNVIGSHIDIWTMAYGHIAALNEVIANVSKMEQTAKAKEIVGEAYFLRALNYFNLSIVYSREPGHLVDSFELGVPVVTEPYFYGGGNIADEASPARAKVEKVWAQIEADLSKAFENLKNNDAGRLPNRGSALAAQALLSRVYLYEGKWSQCVEAATYVIQNASMGIYDGPYLDVFSQAKETLFQLTYTVSENLSGSSLHAIFGTLDNGKRDSEGFGDGIGSGEGELCVAEDFVALFDPVKDKRYAILRKSYFGTEKVWWNTKFNSYGGTFGLDNVPIIRVAEVFLNRAEAQAALNTNLDKALADVNSLRVKRGLAAVALANQADLLAEILLQRRLELAFEGHRFFDLKRRGMDIRKSNGMPSVPYSSFKVVAPLPESELSVNKNLVNNPGY